MLPATPCEELGFPFSVLEVLSNVCVNRHNRFSQVEFRAEGKSELIPKGSKCASLLLQSLKQRV